MTSTTGATEHPDVSEISELTEGVLPPRRTADVRRHLQDCALC
ncbi:zf-HC2 domain-containing protein, partial [Streptomyces sp. NPDC052196]